LPIRRASLIKKKGERNFWGERGGKREFARAEGTKAITFLHNSVESKRRESGRQRYIPINDGSPGPVAIAPDRRRSKLRKREGELEALLKSKLLRIRIRSESKEEIKLK